MMTTGAVIAAVAMALVLLLAFGIDKIFGEPRPRLHPVVWMGSYLQACGSVAARCSPRPRLCWGLSPGAWARW